jgi:superoxide dismutase
MFNSLASSVEGSGWALLDYRPSDKKLVVLQIENHQKLTTWDVIPL